MRQHELIINYMKKYGSITPREAEAEIGCMRLASRICDLRKAGYKIISEKVKTKNRYGKPVYIARYRLKKEDKDGER